MKKTNALPLQEIKASDIQLLNEYLESQIILFTGDILDLSSGVIKGMAVSQNGVSGFTVATGAIFNATKIGELESASGMTLSLPASGTRTDTIAAYYEEVLDTPTSGWVLLDVDTDEEQIQINPKRKFGAAKIAVIQNTLSTALSSGYVALAEVLLATSGIVSITDKRSFVKAKSTNGANVFYTSTDTRTIKEVVDAARFDGTITPSGNITTQFKQVFTQVIGTQTYTYTVLYDPFERPYKVKCVNSLDGTKTTTIKYDSVGNVLSITEV